MNPEYVVVQTQLVGSGEHFEFVSWELSRHRTLNAAKRAGIRELGHDDFNIAVVEDGYLTRWTWMGEDTEPPTTHEELDEIAERLGWRVKP